MLFADQLSNFQLSNLQEFSRYAKFLQKLS